jgi:hypothetical protein
MSLGILHIIPPQPMASFGLSSSSPVVRQGLGRVEVVSRFPCVVIWGVALPSHFVLAFVVGTSMVQHTVDLPDVSEIVLGGAGDELEVTRRCIGGM